MLDGIGLLVQAHPFWTLAAILACGWYATGRDWIA